MQELTRTVVDFLNEERTDSPFQMMKGKCYVHSGRLWFHTKHLPKPGNERKLYAALRRLQGERVIIKNSPLKSFFFQSGKRYREAAVWSIPLTKVPLPIQRGSKEGKVRVISSNVYERDPRNRRLAILYHGMTCKACGFNFFDVYGEHGKDFIEIHHIKPLHQLQGQEIHIDPKKDMIPLCSNCHKMIHRRKNIILSVDELKTMLRK